MEKIILLSNPGSASKKYSVYFDDKEVAWFHIEKSANGFVCSRKIMHSFEKITVEETHYHQSLKFVCDTLCAHKIISDTASIAHVAVRTVIPDESFVQDVVLTPQILEQLRTICEQDPLHITPILEEIEGALTHISSDASIFLISDSTFHITARRRIPLQLEHDLYTIGYHGLSCESVLQILSDRAISHRKLIICHLGGGSSVTGVKQNKSMYNSMEYSPLSGVTMASRSGSIDPLLVMLLMQHKNLSAQDALTHLYGKSGMRALSGVSSDLRAIREEAFKGNDRAKDAVMSFVDSITAHICLALSYTQGIDTLVFTGTIGFRASYIREMVTEKLSWLGIHINHDANLEGSDVFFEISSYASKVKVYVLQIDEMKVMHSHVLKLLSSGKKSKVY